MTGTHDLVCDGTLALRHSFKNVHASDPLDLSLLILFAKHNQNLIWKFEFFLCFYCVVFSCFATILHKPKLIVFIQELFHHRARSRNKLLKLQSLVIFSPPLHATPLICLNVAWHKIIRSLRKFVLGSEVFSLDFALNVIVWTRDNCGLDSASSEFLKINVLCCLGHHLKNIEKLLLLQLNQIFKFCCSYFLVVCRQMVHALAPN